MPFNLKGGRPKNMNQGTYWVQRQVAGQTRVEAHERRIAMANEKATAFNERYERIVQNCIGYHSRHQGEAMSGTQKQVTALTEKITEYGNLKEWIDKHIDDAKSTDLNRLATLGRAVIVSCAKARKQDVHYEASSKVLTVSGVAMKFG
ncbi:hypothetical protein [Sphingobium sp. D43FB]|uniref:hypothetical protein n=1 Tax=Sphingobium sp. D43FB TaxID=2017595 RepID=UPI001143B13F|nr:hypothetical protein [Sphingobium sp. D43FB]